MRTRTSTRRKPQLLAIWEVWRFPELLACGIQGLGSQLPLSNVIFVGARDIDPAERNLIDASAIEVIPTKGDIVAKMVEAIAGRPVYAHLDCDVLDDGIMPSDFSLKAV